MSATDKEMSVIILGSGTCVPSLRRSSCAVLIKIRNQALLFDSGAGTIRRLLEAGTKIVDLTHIFYSHLHPDHTGELVSLLFATKYSGDPPRRIPLNILAGKGFLAFYNGLKRVYGEWIELGPGQLNIVELDNTVRDTRRFPDFTVESMPVEHSSESIAYKISGAKGSTVVYSGDTDFSDNLITLAENADIFICESALPDDLKAKGHLTPSLAGEIAARANVRKLVLTHFYPECDGIDIEKECRKTYDGPLVLAEDLMKMDV
ncbi:MAG: ribonuclease Z [Deltaproteobacteria bacterium]|nr:ribonuclease Z [Deltaproteobacteria bacterium]